MCAWCDLQLKIKAEPAFLAGLARGQDRETAIINTVSALLLKLDDRQRAELDPYAVGALYNHLRALMPEDGATETGLRTVPG